MRRFLSASLPLVLASLASAQITTSNGTAGSVSVASSGGSNYSGQPGTASTATINFSGPGGGTTQDKFAAGPNGPQGTTLGTVSGGDGTPIFNVTGTSSVAGTTPYYSVNFSQQLNNGGPTPMNAGGGTFDPWPVHLSDVSGRGSAVDLYFQSGVRQSGTLGATGFTLPPGTSGSYEFDAYVTNAQNVRQDILSFTVTPTGLASATYNVSAGFQVVLLGSNADDLTASPARRLASGTPIGAAAGLSAIIGPFINSDGTLSRDLQFGILRPNFTVPTSGNPSDTLFSWHADLINRIGPAQATPEPMSLAPLGLSALILLRRRRRA